MKPTGRNALHRMIEKPANPLRTLLQMVFFETIFTQPHS